MDAYDPYHPAAWIAQAQIYRDDFERLCAYPVDALLDAVDVSAGAHLLSIGAETGNEAAAAAQRRGARVQAVDTEGGTVARARVCGIKARYVPLPELPFGDGEFDVVVANFALNYVGRPRATLAEMRRVLRPGGRIALTLWGARRGAGQDLSRQAREAGGALLPEYRLRLDPGEDFVRTPEGLVEFLGAAGFTATETTELAWEHRTDVESSWGGVLAGIARYGLTMTPQHRETLTRIRDEFDRVSAEFAPGDEKLALPHIAMLGWASA